MKYIKNIFALTLSVVILFSFTACSDKKTKSTMKATIPTSLNSETKELINKILQENEKDHVESTDKYKSKLSVATPKNPKMSDYDFKKGISTTQPSNDDSLNGNGSSYGDSGYSGSGYVNNDGSNNVSFNQNFYPAYRDLVNYVMSKGTKSNGVYCITELFDEEDKKDNSVFCLKYDENAQNCYVEFHAIDENNYNIVTYSLDVPKDKKNTKLILTVFDKNNDPVAFGTYINANSYTGDTKITFGNTGLSEEDERDLEEGSKDICYLMVSFLSSQIAKSGTGYTIADYGFTSM